MRRLILIVNLLLIASVAFSQNKAEEIIKKTSEKIKSYSCILADFDFIMQNEEENLNDKYAGKLYLKKDKYFLNLMNVDIYFDGETQYSYLIEANEVTIRKPDKDDDVVLNPMNIFTIFESGFSPKFIKEISANKRKLYSIDLFPEDKDKEYDKINIQIDKTTYHPIRFTSFGKNGSNVILQIHSFDTKNTLEDSQFTFDYAKHKGVEIIEIGRAHV